MMLSQIRMNRSSSAFESIGWLFRHIFSFETLFVAYLYSNAFKQVLPKLPLDETVLFGGFCILAMAYIVFREGIFRQGLYVTVSYMVFVGWVVCSYAWSPSQILAKQAIYYLLTFDLLAVAAGSLIIANRRERAVRFLVVLLAASMYFAIQGIIIYIEYGSFRFYEGFAGRTYLLWGYAVTSGSAVAFMMAIYSRFGSAKQVVAFVMFAIMVYFLLIATGRGALLSLGIACLVPLMISRPIMRRGYLGLPQWQLAALGLVIIVVVYGAYLVVSGQSAGTISRFGKLFDQARNPELVLSVNRFAYFAAAIDQWLQNPILGGGVRSFSIFFVGVETPGTIPHNLILELLSQYGIIGFMLFGLFLGTAVRHAGPQRLRRDPLLLCIFMLFISRLTGAMFGIDLTVNFPFLAFLAVLALRESASVDARLTNSGLADVKLADSGPGRR